MANENMAHDHLAQEVRRLEAAFQELKEAHHDLVEKHIALVAQHDDLVKKHTTLARAHTTLTTKHTALAKVQAALATEQAELATKQEALAEEVEEIQHPKSAAEIAAVRLPEYRRFSPDKLKVELAKDRPDVLVEIASRLDVENDTDSKVLTNLVTFVQDEELMAKLVTFAGAKVKSAHSASGGTRNGR